METTQFMLWPGFIIIRFTNKKKSILGADYMGRVVPVFEVELAEVSELTLKLRLHVQG